jgi:hypothetical protein
MVNTPIFDKGHLVKVLFPLSLSLSFIYTVFLIIVKWSIMLIFVGRREYLMVQWEHSLNKPYPKQMHCFPLYIYQLWLLSSVSVLASLITLPIYLQALADGVIPNEYGINPKQKLIIGSKVNSCCKKTPKCHLTLQIFEQLFYTSLLEPCCNGWSLCHVIEGQGFRLQNYHLANARLDC